jgi:hypothetical protein
MRKNLNAGEPLFRWSGHAFLALLSRTGNIERVRTEIARVMEIKLEHTIQTASRTVMVPIVARWTLFPILAVPRLMCQKIDTFVTVPTQRD